MSVYSYNDLIVDVPLYITRSPGVSSIRSAAITIGFTFMAVTLLILTVTPLTETVMVVTSNKHA